jgi:hypothetical protein
MAPLGEERKVCMISVGVVKERDHLEEVGTDRREDFNFK